MQNTFRKISAAILGFYLLLQQAALACPTCRVNIDHPTANAADASVIALGIIAYTVIGGIVSFFVYLGWRAKNPLEDPSKLAEEGDRSHDCDIWG